MKFSESQVISLVKNTAKYASRFLEILASLRDCFILPHLSKTSHSIPVNDAYETKRFIIATRLFLFLFDRQHDSDDVHARCCTRARQRTVDTTRLRVRHDRLHALRQPRRLAEVSAARTDDSQRARHHRTTVLRHRQIPRNIPSTRNNQISDVTHHLQLVS